MNLKIIKVLFILCYSIFIISCNSRKSEYQKIIGQEYYSLREFRPFVNFKEYGGTYININDSSAFTLNHYKSGVNNVIAFEKIVDKSQRRVKYTLLDILEISDLKQNQYLGYGICRLNEIPDQEIIAIYESADMDVEFYTHILKAWRANSKTRKIEEISINNLDCMNEGYGEE